MFRSLAGLGSGVNQVSERLYVAQAIDRTRLAFANGVLSAAGSAGAVLGPTVGGLLVGVVGHAAAVPGGERDERASPRSRRCSCRSPPTEAPREDRREATARHGDRRPEDRRPTPAVLVVLFLIQTSFQAGFGAFITTYAVFTQERLGWATAEVGLVFSAFGLGSILLGPVLANLADRRGRRDVAILGAGLVLLFPIVVRRRGAAARPVPRVRARWRGRHGARGVVLRPARRRDRRRPTRPRLRLDQRPVEPRDRRRCDRRRRSSGTGRATSGWGC